MHSLWCWLEKRGLPHISTSGLGMALNILYSVAPFKIPIYPLSLNFSKCLISPPLPSPYSPVLPKYHPAQPSSFSLNQSIINHPLNHPPPNNHGPRPPHSLRRRPTLLPHHPAHARTPPRPHHRALGLPPPESLPPRLRAQTLSRRPRRQPPLSHIPDAYHGDCQCIRDGGVGNRVVG